ncbi:MAG: PASTA domain-containing protein [Deltaproteobacteria bacterium]|nr:PASTA domain-containing protein [Deltaproteobacteria bacterium]
MGTGKVIIISFFVSLVVSVCVFFALERLVPPLEQPAEAVVEDPGAEVPPLGGLSPEQARRMLRDTGLLLIVTGRVESAEIKEGLIVSQTPLEGSSAKEGTEVDVVVSKGMPASVVPDLSGLTREAAMQRLEQAGLVAEIAEEQNEEVQKGQVIAFEPAAGSSLAHNSPVTLKVSSGGPPIEVPRVIRARIGGAKQLIRRSGFKVGQVTYRDDPEAPGSTVLRQDPKAGTTAEKGSKIDIWVNTPE